MSDEENLELARKIFLRALSNIAQSLNDDYVQTNAKSRVEYGMAPKIVRKLHGETCAWCSKLAGVYKYGEEPHEVYQRHDNCDCTVDYVDGKITQNVHTKVYYIKDDLKSVNEEANGIGIADFQKAINPGVAKQIVDEIKRAKEEILAPIIVSVSALDSNAGYDGEYRNGRISLLNIIGKNARANLIEHARKMKNDGKWSTASEMHTTRHEIGHGIFETIRRNDKDYELKSKKILDIMNKIKDSAPEEVKKRRKYYSGYLSEYGFDSIDEFVAESVAEFLNGKPRETARAVVEILKEGY